MTPKRNQRFLTGQGNKIMKPNLRLKSLILQIVKNQIKNNDPPETKETLVRLLEEGNTRQEAIEKIALIVIEEIYDILKNKQEFNRERFVSKLKKLS